MGRLRFPLALACLGVALLACVGPPMPMAGSLDEVLPAETIVVGKIELDPPLEVGEQKLDLFTKGFRNKIILLTDQQLREIGRPSAGDYTNRIEAELGETFYARAPNAPFYINKGEIFMRNDAKAPLPAGFKVDIRQGDVAVYIGTIVYHHDEFMRVSKIVVKDEYDSARRDLRKKFGKTVKLRKALVKQKKR